MSFATLPVWLVGLVAATVTVGVVAIYLLRRTPRPQVVSSLAFWMEALERSRPRLLASTRIPLASLLVSLLVALLLVFEIGGPRFGEGVRGTTVIVVSAGRSMATEEGGTPRIDRAKDEVRSWVDRATGSGEVAVIRAGIRPRVLVPLTSDHGDLARALDGLDLDDAEADLDAAVKLADDVVRARGGVGQILVVADTAPERTTRAPTVLVPVGAHADTLAITRLSARRDPVAVGEYAVEAEVCSFSSRRARARLVVRDRDVVILDQAVALGPLERSVLRGQGFSSAQAELTARLEEIEIAGSRDALAADDVAYAVASPLETTRVLLVTADNPWLERVLSAHPALESRVARPAELASLDPDDFDVVLLDSDAVPLAHRAVLLWNPRQGSGVRLGETLERPRVTATLASHPALGGVRLDAVRIERARALVPAPGDRVLVRSGAHAIGLAREANGHRTVVLGFDLAETDLVEQVAFPLLVHHGVRWLAAHDRQPPLAAEPGTPLLAGAGATVLGPDGEPAELTGGVVHDTERAGIYHVGERALAFDGAGSSAALTGPGTATARARTFALPPLSLLLAAGLLLLVLAEWALLHRGRLS